MDTFNIDCPKSIEEFEQLKALFIEYQNFLAVDLCFQSFEHELLNINEIYKQPKGNIFIVKVESKVIACIAMKPINEAECEMKRLYVKPEYRGLGLGKLLANALIQYATDQGYKLMKLDTLTKLNEAVNLYKSFGFVATSPYVYNPLNEVLYFEKTLN
jgi:putative acetyltransferase